MNPTPRNPAAPANMQSATPAADAAFVAGLPTPPAATSLAELGVQPPTPTVPATLTPTTPEKAANSVPGLVSPTPSQITKLTAGLQWLEVAAVEAALVSVRDACRRGDHQFIEEALIGQAMLLQALGERLVIMSNDEKMYQVRNAYMNMGLRALDNSRKTFATLAALRGSPKNQTNVQLNVGAQPPANEILEVPRE